LIHKHSGQRKRRGHAAKASIPVHGKIPSVPRRRRFHVSRGCSTQISIGTTTALKPERVLALIFSEKSARLRQLLMAAETPIAA
jgi:hypothetical protein